MEVQFAGFGGQGIVLAGYLLGKALAVYEGKNASMTQSYGPEARGGACSSGVVISPDPQQIVDYPKVTRPDVLVVMSQEALTTYLPRLKPGGTLIYDADLVSPQDLPEGITAYAVPATRIAETEIGKRIVANVVMLGALVVLTGVVSQEAMAEAIRTTVKPDYVELNLKALEVGMAYAKGLLQPQEV